MAQASLSSIKPPKLLDQVRDAIRTRHYSLRTEETYLHWIKRFILFHGKRHPREMGAPEVEKFLSDLAVRLTVSASTQNLALSSVLFLYREVLGIELDWLEKVTRAKKPRRLPTVLSRAEVQRLLHALPEDLPSLVARLLYGTGMRLMEGVRLRVKDIDLARCEIVVRDGKGGKDRVTMLPAVLVEPLRAQMAVRRTIYLRDKAQGRAGVWLPDALARKYPNAATDWGGNTSSSRPIFPPTRAAVRSGGTISTSSRCSGWCGRPGSVRTSPRRARRMCCATLLPRT